MSSSGSKMTKQHGLIPKVLAQLFAFLAPPGFVLLDRIESRERERALYVTRFIDWRERERDWSLKLERKGVCVCVRFLKRERESK